MKKLARIIAFNVLGLACQLLKPFKYSGRIRCNLGLKQLKLMNKIKYGG